MFPGRKYVSNSHDFQRILRLPRRKIDGSELVDPLTQALKTTHGTMKLRPLQAQALYDMGTYGGLFGPLRVGAGKTLVTLLAPLMMGAKKPVLLMPAALMGKTERIDRPELARHWRIPIHTRIISYTALSVESGARLLDFYEPDLIIADECHKLKNKRAGVTKRVVRYMKEHPNTKFVGVSGTVMKGSIKDFAHILRWCLKNNAPVPLAEHELEVWAAALDYKVNMFQRTDPGELSLFCDGSDAIEDVRRGFQGRLLDTPGVVGSAGDQVACSLIIEGHIYPVGQATEKNFEFMRKAWHTPDGWPIMEATDMWRHARELALGMHYVWDPRPPPEWLSARREWAAFVRETLRYSRTLDTELQVAHAYPDCEELLHWRSVKDSFRPNTLARWHDTAALEFCLRWMEEHKGIVWTEHTHFAQALSKAAGRPYFGPDGVDQQGNQIEKASGAVIASMAANCTGRNLQKWNRNLLTAVPNALMLEQLLGRTHRDGQDKDEVYADIMLGCAEHIDAFERAVYMSRVQEDMLGSSQKLLIADILMPQTPVHTLRWQKVRNKPEKEAA